jgi:hypothetical protein
MTMTDYAIKETEQQELIDYIYGLAAGYMREGMADKEIVTKLEEEGLDSESADAVVQNLVRMRKQEIKAQGNKNMGFGALWLIGGIVITAATYSAASGGGTYVVTYGAIVFGAIQFLQGLFQNLTAK